MRTPLSPLHMGQPVPHTGPIDDDVPQGLGSEGVTPHTTGDVTNLGEKGDGKCLLPPEIEVREY